MYVSCCFLFCIIQGYIEADLIEPLAGLFEEADDKIEDRQQQYYQWSSTRVMMTKRCDYSIKFPNFILPSQF